MNPISSIALSGMSAAQLGMDAAARKVASTQTPDEVRDVALVEGLVQQTQSVYAFKANLRTLKTADEVLGTLLDVMA